MQRLSIFIVLLHAGAIHAEDWPAWRGPTGQGFSNEKNMPLKWSETKNVKWKIALEHQGNSTPVVWGDKIFLTQANRGGSVRSLLCLARADGKLLWQKDVKYPFKEQNWNQNWYCNASPMTDGERVVVSFGSAGMYCYDVAGKLLWKRTDLGKWRHRFGNASSPVLHKELAILWCGPNEKGGRNFLLAVNKRTGKTAWEHDEKVGSWCTPVITKISGKDQLLLNVVPYVKGINPIDGKVLWYCKGLTKFAYTSTTFGNGVAVGMSGYGGAAFAVKIGGTGDITDKRLWLHPRNKQRVGSGMVIGKFIYIVDENGAPRCYELITGRELWQVKKRPSVNTWGSMVHVDGRLFVLMRNGETLVFDAGPQYKLLAINRLSQGEQTNSSPAISNGDVFIRTFRHLWCIRKQ